MRSFVSLNRSGKWYCFITVQRTFYRTGKLGCTLQTWQFQGKIAWTNFGTNVLCKPLWDTLDWRGPTTCRKEYDHFHGFDVKHGIPREDPRTWTSGRWDIVHLGHDWNFDMSGDYAAGDGSTGHHKAVCTSSNPQNAQKADCSYHSSILSGW